MGREDPAGAAPSLRCSRLSRGCFGLTVGRIPWNPRDEGMRPVGFKLLCQPCRVLPTLLSPATETPNLCLPPWPRGSFVALPLSPAPPLSPKTLQDPGGQREKEIEI